MDEGIEELHGLAWVHHWGRELPRWLKNRGVQTILITCVDNLTGFTEAIAASYPTRRSKMQHSPNSQFNTLRII
jgi:hypothetical protein